MSFTSLNKTNLSCGLQTAFCLHACPTQIFNWRASLSACWRMHISISHFPRHLQKAEGLASQGCAQNRDCHVAPLLAMTAFTEGEGFSPAGMRPNQIYILVMLNGTLNNFLKASPSINPSSSASSYSHCILRSCPF